MNVREYYEHELAERGYAPDAAHWATHAGVDFTDRQRIKRKAARWKRMFSELPAGERIAILAALLEVDS